LNLEWGRYCLDYSLNGNILALGGSKGHIALLDWKSKNLKCEINVKENIRAIKFLQSENIFAVIYFEFK